MSHAQSSAEPMGLNGLEKMIISAAFGLCALVATLAFGVHAPQTVLFVVSCLALLLLAWVLGESTDQLGHTIGPRASGILNATFGNLPELVIVLMLVNAGLPEVAKASIIGSILGNMLLVLGAAFFFGGLRNGSQSFTRMFAGMHSSMLILGVVGLAVPTALFYRGHEASEHLGVISVATAGVLFVTYIASLVMFFRSPKYIPLEKGAARWSRRTGIALLALAAGGVALSSEILVHSIEDTVTSWGISTTFLGFILVPIVGNVAEHFVAVQIAWRNDLDFAITVALGSSVQVAIGLAPIAVFLSYALGNPLSLVFEPVQMLAMMLAVVIISVLTIDAESTWLEGLQLMAVYAIIAIAFWY